MLPASQSQPLAGYSDCEAENFHPGLGEAPGNGRAGADDEDIDLVIPETAC